MPNGRAFLMPSSHGSTDAVTPSPADRPPPVTTTRHRVERGDALEWLRGLESGSVQCCVTSPPYYGLRDYGTGKWDGGLPGCDHVYSHGTQGKTGQRASRTFTAQAVYRSECGRCGAVRIDQQIGLESTPDAFVARLVEVFREVRRVLTDDGTAWVNIGDSYAASGRGGGGGSFQNNAMGRQISEVNGFRMPARGYKQKDRIGIPHMLVFALRSDGWYWRDEIVWAKPNTMPESVTDRTTKAHEFLFLLSKSERYHYDADAIAPPAAEASYARLAQDLENQTGSFRANGGAKTNGPMKAVRKGGGASFGKQNLDATGTGQQSRTYDRPQYLTRNSRSVWWIATEAYHDAHFAVMPSKLVEPCILAGSRPGDTVIDPFAGSGTTLAVAAELGRVGIGCDLNPDYVALAEERLSRVTPTLFAHAV